MGWDPWEDIKDAAKSAEDHVKKGFSSLDDKLSISDIHKDVANVLNLGIPRNLEKAREQEKRANAAAASANLARQESQRTVNFRNMMKSAEGSQLSAAELMNLAATGGFSDSSAIAQSFQSGKSQVMETGKYNARLDSLGAAEAAAMDAMRTAEQKYGRRMMWAQTGINVGTSIGLKAFGL